MAVHHKLFAVFFFNSFFILAQTHATLNKREHLLLDQNWKFAFGHPFDTEKDFNNGTAYFSYLSKAGFGDGAAKADFDDRAWRKLDLPHDWAVEQPFSKEASYSHGFKNIGRRFPETSVGWYRKKISIPPTDLGRRIHIQFDGIFRNAVVWFNGHYLGTHASGYLFVDFDITDYVNYGGENTIAVRVDATMEEGWFYEGAGIYRHVWLNKSDPVHVAENGTFVRAEVSAGKATLSVLTTVRNDGKIPRSISIMQEVVDAAGRKIKTQPVSGDVIAPLQSKDITADILVADPKLWSIENPYLYKLLTTIMDGDKAIDVYETTFGIRTIRFDPNEGFFLNGKHIKIKGTNNHQDHAGVGSAIPDALQDFRIRQLKSFGSNAYRCSHNPPTPELLSACDRLGLLVIDENRLMGITETHLGDVKKMIERDRNHPCIISWSIGNEEWGIENDITGARIASTMQAYVKSLDPTRPATAAFSGGIGSNGITTVMDLLGINYIANKSTDKQHELFPDQCIWGTEEGSTNATRGAYFRDDDKHIIPAYDKAPSQNLISIEQGWKHYDARPYLAGMFIWTGFDYRGEPTPYDFPSTGSYFGMLDQCGFYKDDAWYLKSWWQDTPVLHLLPHWNWPGKEGQPIEVWTYSNCDEVELFLNRKSLGRKKMEQNGHLEWQVNYQPGKLEAIGYKAGKKIISDIVNTTAVSKSIYLEANKDKINSQDRDIALITVGTKDSKGLKVPTAENEVTFSLSGPAKIIGVGNGDPTSLEPDQFLPQNTILNITGLKEKFIPDLNSKAETAANLDISQWQKAFTDNRDTLFGKKVKAIAYRTTFDLPGNFRETEISLFYNSIGEKQSLFINGIEIASSLPENKKGDNFKLDKSILHAGKNDITIMAIPLTFKYKWGTVNINPGTIQIITPASKWRRKLFNGLAQVIIQSTGEEGEIALTASSDNIQQATFKLQSKNNK